MTDRPIPESIKEAVEQIASDLDDIHFNSRHASWIDAAREVVAAALLARDERAARIAMEHVFSASQWGRVDDALDGGNRRAEEIAEAILSEDE